MPAAKSSHRTAGEGSGRTARMHIPEESDSGVVPMSHSNNDGQLSAESGEGRLLIKENARQPDTLSTQSEIRVSPGWVGVRQAARENSPAHRFCRRSSAIRAVCANERMYGSVRGAISNGRPYRDPTTLPAHFSCVNAL